MILQNAVMRVSDRKIFKSCHRHDYVEFVVDRKKCFIDGGNDYLRSGGPIGEMLKAGKLVSLVVSGQSTLDELCQKLAWGVSKKNIKLKKDLKGSGTHCQKLLQDLDTGHLEAILKSHALPAAYQLAIAMILAQRGDED